MKKNVLITFFLLLCIPIFAQKKDTLKLSVVEIREKQYVWMNGLRVSRIEMSALQKNDQATLAEVLQTNTPVFIKSYGQGGLSTVSLRGAGASHTQVLWNGLRINSPMLGQVDLSQQPVFFIDEITLVHGASDMAYGTATAGGSLLMKNKPDWSLPLRVQVSAGGGSFSALNGSALVRVTQDQTQFCTRIQHTLAENNFTYHDNSVTKPWPLKTRTDAAFSQTSLMQEIYTNLSSNKQLSFQLWGEQQNREIPSSLLVTQPEGNESQTTSFLRSVLQFKNSTGKGMLT
ncbi:MAG: TonB-dependent receptor plug domain-containing protein, partial [Bacteroidota bacterium]